MSQIILNQKQIEKISEIASLFKTIQHFKLESNTSSGICTSLSVTFDLSDKANFTKLFDKSDNIN